MSFFALLETSLRQAVEKFGSQVCIPIMYQHKIIADRLIGADRCRYVVA